MAESLNIDAAVTPPARGQLNLVESLYGHALYEDRLAEAQKYWMLNGGVEAFDDSGAALNAGAGLDL